MSQEGSDAPLDLLFEAMLSRLPSRLETEEWKVFIASEPTFAEIMARFTQSAEYKRRRPVKTEFPPGHYYSPVVNPKTVRGYVERNRDKIPAGINAISISTENMISFWDENLSIVKSTYFPEKPEPGWRFYYNNGSYPCGDAITLRLMLARYEPRRIVEIGCGFTTACMLDTIDEFQMQQCQITCIEPFADRLRGMLWPVDEARVSLLEMPVQDVDQAVFDELRAGDFLFIDSTHVLKTGSDVHFELLHLLPRLQPGVLIHFHDIQYPFEYPNEWIFDRNLSWNEAYMLQAFLMYNEFFEIVVWNSLLGRYHGEKLSRDCPSFMRNPGSSLWLRKKSRP